MSDYGRDAFSDMAPVTPTTTERGDAVVFDPQVAETAHAASQSILRFARVAPASPLTLALSEELSPENEAIDQARCRTFDGTHRDSSSLADGKSRSSARPFVS